MATLQGLEGLALAGGAGQLDDLLLRRLGLLVEDGLRLATEPALLTVVAPLTLDEEGVLALLVEGGLVNGMLPLALAEGPALRWVRDHFESHAFLDREIISI